MGLVLWSLLFLPSTGDDAPRSSQPSVHDLAMEVSALLVMHQFDLQPEQLKSLQLVSDQTSQPAGARPSGKYSAEARRVLHEFRDALAKGQDPAGIQKLQGRFDEIREAEKLEVDDGWEITEAARKLAPEQFKSLSARQVAAYLAGFGDQFPDPVELFQDALDQVRGLTAEEWREVREIMPMEIGQQAAGLDSDKAARISDKVVQILIQARAMKNAEFKEQKADLLKTGREVIGPVGALDVIRNSAENSLAEFLSNPRLPQALAARLNQGFSEQRTAAQKRGKEPNGQSSKKHE